ncbi:MAG: ferredoxin [Elusimicrobia bacterium]|nr:ferredoxin [Elusimicrobiota bacterium]
MKVKVDSDACIGCSLCVNLADEVFEMSGDVAKVKTETVPAGMEDAVREAAESCAVDAITVED